MPRRWTKTFERTYKSERVARCWTSSAGAVRLASQLATGRREERELQLTAAHERFEASLGPAVTIVQIPAVQVTSRTDSRGTDYLVGGTNQL